MVILPKAMAKARAEILRLWRFAFDRTIKQICPNCGHCKIHYNMGHQCTSPGCVCGKNAPVPTVDQLAMTLCPSVGNTDLYFKWLMSVPEAERDHLRVFSDGRPSMIDDYEKRFDWSGFRDLAVARALALDDYDLPIMYALPDRQPDVIHA